MRDLKSVKSEVNDSETPTEEQKPMQNPGVVREVVLPLAVVMTLIGNALFVGVAWGKFSFRMDVTERSIATEQQRNTEQDRAIQALKDRAHDLERDRKEDIRNFLMLDNYTRGRIDHLPYKTPPPRVQ